MSNGIIPVDVNQLETQLEFDIRTAISDVSKVYKDAQNDYISLGKDPNQVASFVTNVVASEVKLPWYIPKFVIAMVLNNILTKWKSQ